VAAQQPGRAANKQLTLAVIPKSIGGEFWETVERGAREAARDWGVAIKWDGAAVETELAEQNKIIENMVNLGVDGMALAPLNNRVMRKSVENVVAAGIPVVIFDSPVDGDAHVSYVGTDNVAGGALAARYLAARLQKRMPASERPAAAMPVFVLGYIQGTASTEQRTDGFLKAAAEAGLDVVAQPYSEDATVAGAIKTASNSLERFVQDGRLAVEGIFATNLFSTLGMLEALEDLRQSGVAADALFVGFDTSPKLLEELQNGRIDALVAQNPRRIGYLAVETLVRHLRGEKVQPIIDTGAEVVTRERLESDPQIRKLIGLE
jgi:ribose transport system substrate-binding protein